MKLLNPSVVTKGIMPLQNEKLQQGQDISCGKAIKKCAAPCRDLKL